MDAVEKNLINFRNDLRKLVSKWRIEANHNGYRSMPTAVCNSLVRLEDELKYYNDYVVEED